MKVKEVSVCSGEDDEVVDGKACRRPISGCGESGKAAGKEWTSC